VTVYLESSAALAWLLGEPRAGEVRAAVDGADRVVSSALTLTEVRRALVRAERLGELAAADGRRLRGLLARAARGWVLMEVSGAVLARADEAFPAEPVRTLNAVHLSTALLFAGAYADLAMLTFDERVARNAEALGFS
jgi:predicted nucleic acid-binding protein